MPNQRVDEADSPQDVYLLRDLEQLKVIADPLRVRILESVCDRARTTKQVAELLGEKPTRLYHHVDALERVGLIRLAETRQNRGTVEKYYRAVAKLFRADPALFGASVERADPDTLQGVVTTMMDNTTAELREVLASGVDVASGEAGVMGYVELRAPAADVDRLRKRLLRLLREIEQSCSAEPEGDDLRRFRLMLAYYPLDLHEKDS